MKLLLVTFEMGTDGTFFSDGDGAEDQRDESQVMYLQVKLTFKTANYLLKNLSDHYNILDFGCIWLFCLPSSTKT